MNRLAAIIETVETCGSITRVELKTPSGTTLKLYLIENSDESRDLKRGNAVMAIFKETEVILGRQLASSFSVQNRINARVVSIAQDSFLTRIILENADGTISALVDTVWFQTQNLAVDQVWEVYIKMNEIMLER